MAVSVVRDMALRDLLRTLRRKSGMSQEALAHRAGITVGALRKIEQGDTTNPEWITVRNLARVLGVSLDDFAKDDDSPREDTREADTQPKGRPRKSK